MTGIEFLNENKCNPDYIKYDGKIYNESDLATMNEEDYNEVMENGLVCNELGK